MFLPHNGLVDSASEKAIPLDSVQVFANMIDMCLEVTLIQRYTNKEENPIEALYRFPLPKDASLCGFQAEIDGVKLNGQVMEKQSAQEKYDDAISSGQGAYLVEKEEQDLEEVFSVLVGNLPPQKTVSIIIKYVTEVSLYNNQLRFVLPTTISPLAALSIDSDNVAVVEEEEKSAVTPVNSQVGAEVGNKFSIDVSIVLKSEILEVTSPSHPIEVHQPSAVANGLKSRHVSLKKGAAPQPFLDTEFVLLVKVDQVFKPRMYIETLDEASLKQSQHQHHHQHQQQQQQEGARQRRWTVIRLELLRNALAVVMTLGWLPPKYMPLFYFHALALPVWLAYYDATKTKERKRRVTVATKQATHATNKQPALPSGSLVVPSEASSATASSLKGN
eukprot:GEZU01026476.1.p1 GENE.GEZU01026476.1~~GEZU01026476.1.p1  ORF type:complete len:389 (+),score=119.12 GEZU01026476.1:143-1309(+)